MTEQTRGYLWIARLGISLGASIVLFLGGPAAALAGGENDAGRDTPAVATATRTSSLKRSMPRPAEARDMAKTVAGKRDPFKLPPPPQAKVGEEEIDGPLPPGVRGLVIGHLRLKGIVREEDNKTMIAVVANRANLAYFLHINEDVYNGVVSRITPDAIYFQQKRPGAGGQIAARELVLRLGSGPQEAR
ncbi:MAG TPA: hypothetical protein VFL79_02165 [Terriglobia bacterium]|nr:hypothetical protein [Terriglobia bacterium]